MRLLDPVPIVFFDKFGHLAIFTQDTMNVCASMTIECRSFVRVVEERIRRMLGEELY